MKNEMKEQTTMKQNNKGFSLVELIVVIAIMAVLIGVLAPAYLRYVEKSRVSTDNDTISNVATSIKNACAEEDVYKGLDSTVKVTITDGAVVTADNTDLQTELQKSIAGKMSLKSKVYGKTVELTVSKDASSDAVTVVGKYFSNPNDSGDASHQW